MEWTGRVRLPVDGHGPAARGNDMVDAGEVARVELAEVLLALPQAVRAEVAVDRGASGGRRGRVGAAVVSRGGTAYRRGAGAGAGVTTDAAVAIDRRQRHPGNALTPAELGCPSRS